jgi:hypothetical protein
VESESLVHVDQHVLQFKDAETKLEGIWTNDPFGDDNKGLGVAEGSIWMTDFSRAAGKVPILVEVHSKPPAGDDLDDYDGVIEGTLALPSGQISIENESGRQAAVKVPPGTYGVRVHYAGKDTCRYDYSDGAEHARLVLFASPAGTVKILKPIENTDDPVREYRGKRTEEDLIKMLDAQSTSHRCVAAIALLRLGHLDRVLNALASSPVAVKRVATSGLWFAGEKAQPQLAVFARDEDGDIRTRAAQSLGFLKSASARPTLEAMLEDDEETVKEAAQAALEEIG